ncbi:MAG: energy transducer TonB [Flavobacteriales bacterium]|nr:energy transducer TonB [Flavobacteriales bacterium]
MAILLATSAFAQDDVAIPVEQVPVRIDAQQEEPIYDIVEVMPEYPGGQRALMNYLTKNLKFPDEAREQGVQGTVFIVFIVEMDGRISGVRVLRGIGSSFEEEAMRVVRNMPMWQPGTHRGKAVRVRYNLPIRFTL